MKVIDESAIKITPNGIVVQKSAEEPAKHSEDIQEIITKVPSWIIRWGITLFFGILLILLAISVLVRYPDMVKVPIKLQSLGNTASVSANAPGVITRVFVWKEQQVKNGQALVEIQSLADKSIHVLRAPQQGVIGFSGIIQPQATTVANQELFNIHPKNQHFFGIVQINQNDISKVKEGQDVLIKLSNYSSEKSGPLKGKIEYLANEPNKNGFFVAKIALNNNLDVYKNIRLGSWMKGEAQIVTEDVSLQNRVLNSITKGLQ